MLKKKEAQLVRRKYVQSMQFFLKNNRDAEGFERSLRKKLSVGDLMTMHKEGRSNSDETILQVVELHEDEIGNLHSLHCQTVSMSATISKHYLPHLSAITTFFLWNTLTKL